MSGTRRARAVQPALACTLAALTAGATAAVAVVPAAGQDAEPVVSIDRTGTAAGEQILVTGGGWTAGTTVLVELCGQGGLRGSVDCDVSRQAVAAVGASGTFTTVLPVGTPPSPCPCVVRAADQSSARVATTPVAVQGIPTVPIGPTTVDLPDRRIEVTSVEVGGGGWSEWFGVPATRTLAVTLVNTGAVGIDEPEVAIAWGPGERPSGLAEGPPPSVGRMEPGDARTFEVELPATGFAFGRRSAVVEVQGLDETSTARVGVTTYPWALLVAASAAGLLVLRRMRNRVRPPLSPPASDPDGLDPPPPDDDDEVIDLRDSVILPPSDDEAVPEPDVEDAIVAAGDDWDRRAAAAAAELQSLILSVEVLDLTDGGPSAADDHGTTAVEIEALRAEVDSLAVRLQHLGEDQAEIRASIELLQAATPAPEPVDELDQRIANACRAALRSGSSLRRPGANGHLAAQGGTA